jgi:hypothetical protein
LYSLTFTLIDAAPFASERRHDFLCHPEEALLVGGADAHGWILRTSGDEGRAGLVGELFAKFRRFAEARLDVHCRAGRDLRQDVVLELLPELVDFPRAGARIRRTMAPV